jgi:hypothetical protein
MGVGTTDQGWREMATSEQQDRLARERAEIAARIANFKATQEKFQRERDEYYAATLRAARTVKWNRFAGGDVKH